MARELFYKRQPNDSNASHLCLIRRCVRSDPSDMDRRKIEGALVFLAFMACIPIANWMIGNVGTQCIPDGPCLIPVAPNLTAPSGVLMIGVALVLRDIVQRRLGKIWSLAAIAAGAILSGAIAPPSLVLASATAFFISELADFAVYTPLQRRRLVLAVFASGSVGAIVDSIVFLYIAFGSLQFLAGQIIGKAVMVIGSLPIIALLRWRDERIGLSPA
jgi:queuosine precursor transporter